MKRRILIALGIVTAVAAVVIAIFLVVPPAVEVAEAQEGELVDTLVATGEVTPRQQPVLTAGVSAPVESVDVEAGDRVEADEVVARLDDTAARLEADQTRAGVAEARARLEAVTDEGAPTALENFQQASRDLEAARQDHDRAVNLYEAGVGTRQTVDEARRAVERAESEVQRARTSYRQATEEGSDHQQAAAALTRAQAQHDQARRRLEDYTIRAPTDATVLSREVDPGDSIQVGGVVATLGSDGPFEIRINPDERELANLEAGQPAVAVTDAYPDRAFGATVRRVDPSVDPERGTITARLGTDDGPDFLRPAMTVTVDIELDRRDEALVVPRSAIRDLDTDAPWVLRLDDGRASRMGVHVGLEDDRAVEITEGLGPGDIVVADPDVEPDDRIRRGEEIDPVDEQDLDPQPDRQFEPPEPPTAAAGGSTR